VSPVLLALLAAALAAPTEVSGAHVGHVQGPSWAPGGARIAYEVNDHEGKTVRLFTVAPGDPPRPVVSGGSPTSLTAGFRRSTAPPIAHELAWSPPALARFVFTRGGAGAAQDLHIQDVGPVAVAPGADGGADWSADGRWIVFTSSRSGQGDLYRLDTQDLSAPPERLTTDAGAAELSARIAPDSRRVVYVAHTDRGDNLFLLPDLTRPTSPTSLTPWPGAQVRPTWSPDGQHIAFYANHEDRDRWDLVVLSKGGRVTVHARGVVLNQRGPTWTPDGRALIAVLDDDDRFDPVVHVPLFQPDALRVLATDTVGNQDTDVTQDESGRTWLALTAQGRTGDVRRAYRKLYVMQLDEP